MWDYMDGLKNRYHIFVANSHKTAGVESYQSLLKELKDANISPSNQILYLFSGGYKPGRGVLENYNSNFSKVFLVDIWMGNSDVGNFYKGYVKSNSSKVLYFYTSYGANNESARDYIAKTAYVSEEIKEKNGHMKTNNVAVNKL